MQRRARSSACESGLSPDLRTICKHCSVEPGQLILAATLVSAAKTVDSASFCQIARAGRLDRSSGVRVSLEITELGRATLNAAISREENCGDVDVVERCVGFCPFLARRHQCRDRALVSRTQGPRGDRSGRGRGRGRLAGVVSPVAAVDAGQVGPGHLFRQPLHSARHARSILAG